MLEKITAEQLVESGVVSAPDKLTGKPKDNKKLFDRLVADVVTPALNAAIDSCNQTEEMSIEMAAAEGERKEAEIVRCENEEQRQRKEDGRERAEDARVTAEEYRAEAERLREEAEAARRNSVTPVRSGGTGAETAEEARENLGAAAAEHRHTAAEVGALPARKGSKEGWYEADAERINIYGKGYGRGTLRATDNSMSMSFGDYNEDGGEVVTRSLLVRGVNAAAETKDALVFQEANGDLHRIYGEHNKPRPADIGAANDADLEELVDTVNDLVDTVNDLETSGGGTSFTPDDETLVVENGVMRVRTTDEMAADNTLPITSAAVQAVVGNINALLETI